METKWYQISYVKRLEDQEEIIDVDWEFPDLKLLLREQSNRVFTYRTDADAENSQRSYCTIQVKVKILGKRDDLMEVYYRTLDNVYLKCSLEAFKGSYYAYKSMIREITINYRWVEANKWKLLSVLHNPLSQLHLKISFYVNVIINGNNKTSIDEEELNNTSNTRLITDFEKLLFDPLLSDVTVKSVEGDEIPAHKLLLITRSAVLKAHFEHDTIERSTNIVETLLESEVLKEVLSYIYTDKVPKLDQVAAKLFAAADYYQLSGLKGICEEALRKQLTVENAIDTLELATLYMATTLKDSTLEFIHDDNGKEFIQTEAWKTLRSIEVIKSIYEYGTKNSLRDSKMETKGCNISYNKRLEDQEEISEVVWTIPDLSLVLREQSNREFTYRTDADNCDGSYCTIQIKVTILGKNADLMEVYYQTLDNVYLKCTFNDTIRRELKIDYRWVEANKWQFLSNFYTNAYYHSLRLMFQFRVNLIISKSINDKEDLNNTSKLRLNTDFEKLLFDPLLSDITIKSVEGDEIPAHKLLLITRSDVLKAHFEYDTVERSTNIVETLLETEVLKEVLNYIYTDKVPKLDQMAKKLLAAGDYYQLSGLKGICEKALHKQLTVENAIATLELATLYKATKLKDLTLEFIHDGNSRYVIKTEAWKTLQSIEVIKMIHEYGL